jgi:hypothetical protein
MTRLESEDQKGDDVTPSAIEKSQAKEEAGVSKGVEVAGLSVFQDVTGQWPFFFLHKSITCQCSINPPLHYTIKKPDELGPMF